MRACIPRPPVLPCTTLFRSQQPEALGERDERGPVVAGEVRVGAQDLLQHRGPPREVELGGGEGGGDPAGGEVLDELAQAEDRKSTRLNSSHVAISYAVFCLK